jgi:hypothetical protein
MGVELAVGSSICYKSGPVRPPWGYDEYDFGLICLEYVDKKYSFYFEIFDKNGRIICFSNFDLGMAFSTYDECFRAARKWIRDNQNLVYVSTEHE